MEKGQEAPGCTPRESRTSITNPEVVSGYNYIINPRRGEEPGRDTTLRSEDLLVFIACKPMRTNQYL